MKHLTKFYVVDSLTESVIGSFDAISVDVAKKIVDETYKTNDKLKMVKDNIVLYYSPCVFDVCETYDEIKDCCTDSKWQVVEVLKNE